jgi:signal transduction histidine kinase
LRSLIGMNRMINAALGVVLVVVFAVEEHSLVLSHRDWLLDSLTGLVVGACAVARERNRFLLAVAGLAVAGAAEVVADCCHLPGEPGAVATLALMVLLGSAVRALPARQATTIAAAGAAVFTGVIATHSDLGSLSVQLWALAVAAGLCLRLRDARNRTMIEAVRRGERLDLARELHDAAAHHMTGVVLQAQAARVVARRDPARLDDALDGALAGIEAASSDALTSMRQVIGVLREPDDGGGRRPGHEDLAELVNRFGPSVRLCLPDGPVDAHWPAEVSSTIYRVVQEALTNVARHAPDASDVSVTLARDPRSVTVRVSNDGVRRSVKPGGYGLIGMRERVGALGGTLAAGPDQAGGWSVVATLPV